MPNWTQLANDTFKLNPQVQSELKEWKNKYTDWNVDIFYMNYPPRFIGKFEIFGINSLSDKKLSEAGELVTKICCAHGLMCKKWVTGNKIEYKFWLPIK